MTDWCYFQLVSTNEALEKDIIQLKEGSVTNEAMQSLQDTIRHLQAQNSALQHSISCKYASRLCLSISCIVINGAYRRLHLHFWLVFLFWILLTFAFSALTLLVGGRKSIWSVKIEWWGASVVICLEQSANDLHMVHLMLLPPSNILLHWKP